MCKIKGEIWKLISRNDKLAVVKQWEGIIATKYMNEVLACCLKDKEDTFVLSVRIKKEKILTMAWFPCYFEILQFSVTMLMYKSIYLRESWIMQ